MGAIALGKDIEDEYRRARGRFVGSKSLQTPGIVHSVTAITLGDSRRGEQTPKQEMEAEKLRKPVRHQGGAAGHKQIREQCGTVVPDGQTALPGLSVRDLLFLVRLGGGFSLRRGRFARLGFRTGVGRQLGIVARPDDSVRGNGEVDDNPSLGFKRSRPISACKITEPCTFMWRAKRG